MRCLYLDSSVIVSMVLGDPKRSPFAFKRVKESDWVGTSALSPVECQAGLSTQLGGDLEQLANAEQNLNQLIARMTLYSVDRALDYSRNLIKRYRPSLGLRSLDAIHVATAVLIRDYVSKNQEASFEYLTCDRKQHAAFTAEGLLGRSLG